MISLVRAASLTNYAEVAEISGLNPVRLLLDADLNPSVLVEPDLMIPAKKVGRLLQNSAELSGNESFGLCMASSRLLSNLGPVGLLIRDQPTLRDSLKLLIRYLATLNSALILSIKEEGNLFIIRETVLADDAGEPTRQRTELALGVMIQTIRQLIGHNWQPRRVCLEHSAPKNLALHTKVFGPLIDFNQEYNCIVCAKSDLDKNNQFSDPAMIRYAEKLLESKIRTGTHEITNKVHQAMVLLLPSGRCTIDQVSKFMGVTPRTIQRRLSESGQTFSSSMNNIRRQLASRYVSENRRTLTEIAELLGFTAASSFSRWHKIQFNYSAKEARSRSKTTTT